MPILMEPHNSVKVTEVCRVTPPPDSASELSLPLTFFDIFWFKFAPTQRLFFYQSPNLIHQTFSETILPKLKHSLSITLGHYLPLSGSLTWLQDSTSPVLRYVDGDTMSLTVAESEADFYHHSSDNFRDTGIFVPLLPDLPASGKSFPAMALQITLFPNAGFSIGYTMSHWAGDGKSVSMFMHSWASICRSGGNSGLPAELTPVYERSIIRDPPDLPETYQKFRSGQGKEMVNSTSLKDKAMPESKAPAGDCMMMATFKLTREQIEILKKKYKEEKTQGSQVTSFTVVTGYTWACLAKVRGASEEKVHLVFSMDCRSRLEPNFPSTYFGNCLRFCWVEAEYKELVGEEGVRVGVKAICEALGSVYSQQILEGAAQWLSFPSYVAKPEEVFSIGGSPRFDLYKLDFGFGKPRKVEMVSIGESGAFSLADAGDESGGVEIGIVLKKHQIEAFSSTFNDGLTKF